MKRFNKIIVAVVALSALCISSVAHAANCVVSNSAGDGTNYSLIYQYNNLVDGFCDGNEITFTSGSKDITVNMMLSMYDDWHIKGNVNASGMPTVTIKMASGASSADGNFFRLKSSGPGAAATLENLIIEAPGKVAVELYANASGHTLRNVWIRNSDTGVLVKGSNNKIESSKIFDNSVEGVTVDAGNFNKITMTEFENNVGIGIDLVGGGNENISAPSNLKIVRNDDGSYLIVGEVGVDADEVEIFEVDADDDKEGKTYIGSFSLLNITIDSNTKTATIDGKKLFAQLLDWSSLDGIDITATVTDASNNTSEFAAKGTSIDDSATDCFDTFDAQAFSDNPNGEFCDGTPDLPGTCQDYYDIIENAGAPSDTALQNFIDCCEIEENADDEICGETACAIKFFVFGILGIDDDNDGIKDEDDNCPDDANGPCLGPNNQLDTDGDGLGDVCDACPDEFGTDLSGCADDCLDIDSWNYGADGECDSDDPFINPSNVTCQDYYNIYQDPSLTQAEQNDASAAFVNCCGQDAHFEEQVCQNVGCFFTAIVYGILGVDDDSDGIKDEDDNCPLVANGICAGDNNQEDDDGDGVGDSCDNCLVVINPDQKDTYGTLAGDACEEDPDADKDGVLNEEDNCAGTPNADQVNTDGDEMGDACDSDLDGDGVHNLVDNCPGVPNENQIDVDGDGVGDLCDPLIGAMLADDIDGDGTPNAIDNCIFIVNVDQADADDNGIGDACQIDVLIPSNGGSVDRDGDGYLNNDDNCPDVGNALQGDIDGDGTGDVCDVDIDGDTVENHQDNCPTVPNDGQLDTDGDGTGDACEDIYGAEDLDQDGEPNATDNCILVPNPGQEDVDVDGVGDVCDSVNNTEILNVLIDISNSILDLDSDTVNNQDDNCPLVANPNQDDTDFDGIGDACEGQFYSGDLDGDLVADWDDNCVTVKNPIDPATGTQPDSDGDGIGDACEDVAYGGDLDGDTVGDWDDNCVTVKNLDQTDLNGNGMGDACEVAAGGGYSGDLDGDGVLDWSDNCVTIKNPNQEDNNGQADGDGIGDACEVAAGGGYSGDLDGDTVPDVDDNCIFVDNLAQIDTDGDGIGDACEDVAGGGGYSGDLDGDGVDDVVDNCIFVDNLAQIDTDGDGIGDVCESSVDLTIFNDIDGDKINNFSTANFDNCPFVFNPTQADTDGDDIGDACDLDSIFLPPDEDLDDDGVLNGIDNCPAIDNADQLDTDANGIGDVCQLVVPGTTIVTPPGGGGEEEPEWVLDGGGGFGRTGGCSLSASVTGSSSWILLLMMGLPIAGLVRRRRRK
jgi:hypothetical protein